MNGKGDEEIPDFSLASPNGGIGKIDPTQNGEGRCVVCNIPTTKRCQVCANTTSGREAPFYCGKEHQGEDWTQHKLVCLKTRIIKFKRALKKPTRPVDFLAKCIADDLLPQLNSSCYKAFGFSNCKTEEEESNLLSIYVGLIKLLETDIDLVDEAQRNGELVKLISTEYETLRPDPETRGFYYPWFLKNSSIIP